jgi:hypothetical protein
MRLRPALMTCVIAALLVVGARLTGIAIEREASERNDAQRTTVEVIARDAAGLLVLTQDYGLYRSERAARQWNLVHQRLSRALAASAAAPSSCRATSSNRDAATPCASAGWPSPRRPRC